MTDQLVPCSNHETHPPHPWMHPDGGACECMGAENNVKLAEINWTRPQLGSVLRQFRDRFTPSEFSILVDEIARYGSDSVVEFQTGV